ncbi:MAG TPA: cold shock domain-containing protein [Bacteroidia bacterium]|nr:cold shock domain-containing protein [Bacteroidia bacterium]HQK98899.1 cold shock domain-containing protein [Bacteroidia bacterium]
MKYNGDRDNIFVHINNVLTPITDHDLVTFEVEHTPKGLSAIKVKKK